MKNARPFRSNPRPMIPWFAGRRGLAIIPALLALLLFGALLASPDRVSAADDELQASFGATGTAKSTLDATEQWRAVTVTIRPQPVATATFTVHKDFSDGNTDPVSISLDCTNNGATVVSSPLNASEGNPAVFTVVEFAGDPQCTAIEVVPAGYTANQADCLGVALVADGECTIFNIRAVGGSTSFVSFGSSSLAGGAGLLIGVAVAALGMLATGAWYVRRQWLRRGTA